MKHFAGRTFSGTVSVAGVAVGACTLLAGAQSSGCASKFAPGSLSLLEIFIVVPVALTVLVVFVQAIRYTIRPGEETPDHIKHRILEEDKERL
jgi:hypothetical protein